MTDLEISKELALAIGWPLTWETEHGIVVYAGGLNKVKSKSKWLRGMRQFNYRDWNVIGPIAEQFDMFPRNCGQDVWRVPFNPKNGFHDTPQKAIALAVIGAMK